MIEFHAPWCPACKDLSKTWKSFADWSKDLNVKVAEVDVTANPGLSGRFLVTALPTLYHVKDGVFRTYSGPRDKEDFIKFIEDKKWTVVDPLPKWKHPDTPQMTVVSWFFKLSMSVRDLHNFMVEKKGIPAWGSYLLFGLATLILGCILGFFIVCIIDCVFPAGGKPKSSSKPSDKKDKKQESNKEQQQKDKDGKQKKQQQQKEKEKEKQKKSEDEHELSSGGETQSQSEGDDKSGTEEKVRQRKKDQQKQSPVPNGQQKKK